MENVFSDQKDFTRVNLKDHTLLHFAVNQEKHVDQILQILVDSNRMTEKHQQPVVSRPDVMYCLCKVHKVWAILAISTLQMNWNDFKVKDSFHFAEDIADQQLDFFMGSSNVYYYTVRGFLKRWKAKANQSLRSSCLLLLKIYIFCLIELFINKLMVWSWLPLRSHVN